MTISKYKYACFVMFCVFLYLIPSPFYLEFSQSYQGVKLNFKRTQNRDEYFNHLLLDIIRY